MRKGFLVAALLLPLLFAGNVRAQDAGLGIEDPVYREYPTSNWYAGVDIPVLKPHLGALGVSVLGTDVGITPSYDYNVGPRLWLGWDNAEGLGVRVRYFTFDANAAQSLEAQTFDVEATQRGYLGNLHFQLAGGFRYAKMETGLGLPGTMFGGEIPFSGGIGMDFEGVGPTVAIDVRRPFGSHGLALLGGARSSWMYGQTDIHLTGDLGSIPVGIYADDHMMQINELSLGIEWSRSFERGGKVAVAALWEAQAWEWAPVVGLIHQDIGLTGPTFSFSYMR